MPITRPNLPSFSTLLAFEAAVRLGSFTAAAREFHVSQAAISQKVRELEDWMGGELIARTRPKLATTADGMKLADSIRSAVTTVTRSVESTRRSLQPQNRVVLAATNTFALYWLGPRIDSFYAANPDTELSLITSDREATDGIADFDLGVTFAPSPPAGFEAIRLFRSEIVAVASPGYLVHRPDGLEPGEWNEDVLLHLTADPWLTWSEWMSAVGLRENDSLRAGYFSTYITLLQAVLAGRGIGLGWRALVDPLLEGGELVQIGARGTNHGSAYYLIWNTAHGDEMAESTRALYGWFRTHTESES